MADAAPPPAGRKRSRWDSSAEGAGGDDASKKPKTEAASGAKPAMKSLDALAKAKKALELQKSLKAKLAAKGLQTSTAAAGAKPAVPNAAAMAAQAQSVVAAALASKGILPPSAAAAPKPASGLKARALRLNAEGKEVDEQGNVVERKVITVSTLKVNANIAKKEAMKIELEEPPIPDESTAGFDPSMGGWQGGRRRDKHKDFKFVKKGRFERAAENVRLRAQFGERALREIRFREARERREAELAGELGDPNMIPLGDRGGMGMAAGAGAGAETVELPPVPEVEWWDIPLLKTGSYDDVGVEEGIADLNADKISIYVQHPVQIQPPAEPAPPAPQPLKLTRKEQKKLRTQRRVAREKEKQEMIRQGLMEAPAAKVKVSNMMRVLGEDATADPTKIEQEVRKAMAERQQAHDDRNLARKLTPAEASEKKVRKLFDDTGVDTPVAIYRVGSLANPQIKFKVDVNAQENHMTGVCVITEKSVVVAVEGAPKAQRRYKKLMMNRIDWNAKPPGEEEGMEEDDDDEDKPPNKCMLVWEGVVKKPAWKRWRVEAVRTEMAGRKIFAEAGVGNYWDLALAVEGWEDAPIPS